MRRSVFLMLSILLAFSNSLAQQKNYQPNWESINARPVPAWFDEAKFGIFIHWGVYAVPAWGPKGQYAEWYWHDMQDRNGPTWKFHVATYGEKFQYQDFAPRFKAEMFDPDHWADIFERSGAKYVVLTSKHHEGFCLSVAVPGKLELERRGRRPAPRPGGRFDEGGARARAEDGLLLFTL